MLHATIVALRLCPSLGPPSGTGPYREGMVPGARWLTVAVVAVVVASAPLVTHAFPAHESKVSAARLLEDIRGARDLGWSGEVRSLGSVQVPLSGSTFGGVARLLGEQSDLRVWWRDRDNWRVDRIRATGESDLVRSGGLTVRWNYEENRVDFAPYSPVRLPDDVDVVPSAAGHPHACRCAAAGALPPALADAWRATTHPDYGSSRVDYRSTISRVDVWADEASGLPLKVEVYAEPAGAVPILSTELTSLELERPASSKVNLRFSPGIEFPRGFSMDEAAGANAFAPFTPPSSLADLDRRGRPEDFGAVGVYGRGPTALLAVPLREWVADGLRGQLRQSRNARDTGARMALEVGPLSVLLSHHDGDDFLLAGTVTPATLELAATELAARVVRTQ